MHAAIAILFCAMLTALELGDSTVFFSYTVAYTEQTFTIEHDIQTRQLEETCVFPVKVSLLDSITKKPVPDAVIEIRTGLEDDGVMANKTDKNGATTLSLIINKEAGKTCMELLLSHGYLIQASKTGYAELGIGTVS